jgi:hypothetical protein
MPPDGKALRAEHDHRSKQCPRVREQQLRRYQLRERYGVAHEPAVEVALDRVEHGDDGGYAEQHQREPHLALTYHGLIGRARESENAVFPRLRIGLRLGRRARERAIPQARQKVRVRDKWDRHEVESVAALRMTGMKHYRNMARAVSARRYWIRHRKAEIGCPGRVEVL